MRLLLIRHGQTTNNALGALDTAIPGAALTPLGQVQAAAIPDALAGERVAAVYASRLVRTQMTAAPLATTRRIDVAVRPGLEEIAAGDLELRSDEDAVETYVRTIADWMRGDLDPRVPGGWSGTEFLQRFGGAVDSVVSAHRDDDTVAVVSHGAAIRVFTAVAAGLGGHTVEELRLNNTGMAVLVGDPGSWSLETWHPDPLGGADLDDRTHEDPTGETAPSDVADTRR